MLNQWGNRSVTTGKGNIEQFIIPINPLTILATIKCPSENPGDINFPQLYTYEINKTSFKLVTDVILEKDFNKQFNCWWLAIGNSN